MRLKIYACIGLLESNFNDVNEHFILYTKNLFLLLDIFPL